MTMGKQNWMGRKNRKVRNRTENVEFFPLKSKCFFILGKPFSPLTEYSKAKGENNFPRIIYCTLEVIYFELSKCYADH